MTSSAERIMQLFSGFAGAHGTYGVPEQDPDSLKMSIKATARTPREPVTIALWESHLMGTRPLGVIPIREDGSCLWGSVDIDDYDVNPLEVVGTIEARKLPLVPCRSKSGGLHLFLFLRRAAPAATVQRYLRDVAATLGYARSEIFPKQTEILASRGDVGNWMAMPYLGTTFDGRLQEQVGVKRTGGEQTLEEFLTFAERMRVEPEALVPPRRSRETAGRGNGEEKSAVAFADGPPCLQHLAAKGIGPGMQNNTLLMMGVYFKRKNPSDWERALEDANHALLSPPGSAEGLMGAIRSLRKREYNYTCKTEPMVSHCNSGVCRLRRFGVGEAGAFPVISGISKLDVDPPIWFVNVEEGRLEVSTDVLQNYPKFHAACMDRINRCFMALKQSDWLVAVGAAMAEVNLVEAPREVGRQGIFEEHLEEFLTNRQKGTAQEDLLRNRPWEDEEAGRHYFTLRDLERHLIAAGVKDMPRGRMTTAIKNAGGGHHFFNIKGKGVNVWWVPSRLFERRPVLDPSPVRGMPI